MTFVVVIAMSLLLVAAGFALARVLKPGNSVADRIVALDLVLLISIMGVGVFSISRDTGAFLDVLVVVSLLGFVSTITVARFIERRGI